MSALALTTLALTSALVLVSLIARRKWAHALLATGLITLAAYLALQLFGGLYRPELEPWLTTTTGVSYRVGDGFMLPDSWYYWLPIIGFSFTGAGILAGGYQLLATRRVR